ncbi:cornifelin-like protein [Lates japonicus]|uniref:Cornifelin-like protein n=1 Tax=Lates japonicus TaxID=270547 RepID=A0AAD3M8H4_LATJO|nr:cornifelin-like protein [Lates japonicus]
MASQTLTDWSNGLFDCFEDASTCCYGFWCCPCLACTVSGKFGENQCLPLCDMCSPAVMAACGIPLFVPPAALSLRASMRNRYGIKMHRELKHRKKDDVDVNMEPIPVTTAPGHPPPAGFVSQQVVVNSY